MGGALQGSAAVESSAKNTSDNGTGNVNCNLAAARGWS